MRNASVRDEDALTLQGKIEKTNADLRRYLRVRAGESFAEIAEDDQLDPKQVIVSVRNGRHMFEATQLLELRDKKHRSAIQSEDIRIEAQRRLKTDVIDAVALLIKGERIVPEINKITGQVTFHKITDPDIVAKGVEQARKIMSLDERPAPNQTVVNIQNNNSTGNEDAQSDRETSYEERLQRIRNSQRPVAPRRVIEVEAVSVAIAEEPAVSVDAELVDDGKKDWTKF